VGAYDPLMRSRRHDRHNRVTRADSNRRRRPSDGFRAAHGARFSDLVENAIAELPLPLLKGISGVEVVIETVPPVDDHVIARGEVPLARLLERPEGRRLVVYRRPLELRGTSRGELVEIIRTAIGVEVAQVLGITDVDDLFDDGD
jgi:predicted Zn-dependent protease with MMP-like domain